MLFHMIPFFFLSMVAQETSKLRISDWLLRNFNQSESGYLSYHGEQNGRYHVKEHWKLSWKLVSKNSLHFVGSHHSEKQTVGRSCLGVGSWSAKFYFFSLGNLILVCLTLILLIDFRVFRVKYTNISLEFLNMFFNHRWTCYPQSTFDC